jgi:hypothetical protein
MGFRSFGLVARISFIVFALQPTLAFSEDLTCIGGVVPQCGKSTFKVNCGIKGRTGGWDGFLDGPISARSIQVNIGGKYLVAASVQGLQLTGQDLYSNPIVNIGLLRAVLKTIQQTNRNSPGSYGGFDSISQLDLATATDSQIMAALPAVSLASFDIAPAHLRLVKDTGNCGNGKTDALPRIDCPQPVSGAQTWDGKDQPGYLDADLSKKWSSKFTSVSGCSFGRITSADPKVAMVVPSGLIPTLGVGCGTKEVCYAEAYCKAQPNAPGSAPIYVTTTLMCGNCSDSVNQCDEDKSVSLDDPSNPNTKYLFPVNTGGSAPSSSSPAGQSASGAANVSGGSSP